MSAEKTATDLRFPIGKFDPAAYASRAENINTIANLPADLKIAVRDLSDEQLDTPYRDGGWTLRQTVHHIADSHINSFCRFKLALTEEMPTIRPYLEDKWAELSDSKLSIDVSLSIIEGVHTRWGELLRTMSDEDFARRLLHPETGQWTLEQMTGLYAWHSRHHTAHITSTRERFDWIFAE
ncbi:YfiT family bacillithiol transferase [Leptolyngbya sp. 7M]|uniref:YfiT family bacillithiol transferase n=1 Tax=Leptolyngbya sp. 7M TaxID=2812896 RepID=UPI001B8B8798|nr:bacillithiol transferase BstA [Leptolyngbya sp. 7M]QYO65357.1 bacillithiol transferase BstA [Leptolyngbya sp. 7M]